MVSIEDAVEFEDKLNKRTSGLVCWAADRIGDSSKLSITATIEGMDLVYECYASCDSDIEEGVRVIGRAFCCAFHDDQVIDEYGLSDCEIDLAIKSLVVRNRFW